MSDEEHSRGREDGGGAGGGDYIRDIHALTPPHPRPPAPRWAQLGEADWSSQSTAGGSDGGSVGENIASMSREFSALLLAGSPMHGSGGGGRVEGEGNGTNLARIGEAAEETNRLAIVPDPSGSGSGNSQPEGRSGGGVSSSRGVAASAASAQEVKKEEVEAKIMAWQTAKLAKINNRFKREDAVIKGWEGERVHKATARMKRIERKVEEKRARAMEKMENEVANARRRSEERRASAEAKRGGAAARVLELANLMRAVGRPPVKRSFF